VYASAIARWLFADQADSYDVKCLVEAVVNGGHNTIDRYGSLNLATVVAHHPLPASLTGRAQTHSCRISSQRSASPQRNWVSPF
jgi:hypothetical protein